MEEQGRPIRIAVIGAGQMGRGLVSQTVFMKGMRPALVVDIVPENAHMALRNAGVPEEEIKVAQTPGQADDYIKAGKYVVAQDAHMATQTAGVDCIVDATGITEVGAKLAVESIRAGKHIIMLNVETDVVVGPLLYQLAQRQGVIYTGSAGDEPGAVMELYDFATTLGFEVLALGKGKNNKVDITSTPDTVREEALKKRMSPRMLASFKDGSKTMVELTAMSNATGFLPDVPGGTGSQATVQQLAGLFRLKGEGGMLDRYGVVDYINGVAPGVFAVITSSLPEVHHEMRYLLMGDGPNYTLFRPYHLTSLETPMSVARILLHKQPSIVPMPGAPFSETTTIAKRDLAAGEYLDGIGGYTVYGSIHTYSQAKALNALPLGLVNDKIRMKTAAKKGQLITYDMVEMDESSFIYQLRREQDALLAAGKL